MFVYIQMGRHWCVCYFCIQLLFLVFLSCRSFLAEFSGRLSTESYHLQSRAVLFSFLLCVPLTCFTCVTAVAQTPSTVASRDEGNGQLVSFLIFIRFWWAFSLFGMMWAVGMLDTFNSMLRNVSCIPPVWVRRAKWSLWYRGWNTWDIEFLDAFWHLLRKSFFVLNSVGVMYYIC